jgi:hypothetical protein
MDELRNGRPQCRRRAVRFDSLEPRLALSSYAAVAVPIDLNPLPLPPAIVVPTSQTVNTRAAGAYTVRFFETDAMTPANRTHVPMGHV